MSRDGFSSKVLSGFWRAPRAALARFGEDDSKRTIGAQSSSDILRDILFTDSLLMLRGCRPTEVPFQHSKQWRVSADVPREPPASRPPDPCMCIGPPGHCRTAPRLSALLAPPGVPLHCYPFYTGARTGALPCYCTACLLYIAPVLLLAPRGNPADVPLLCRIYVSPPLYSGVPGGAALEVAQDVADASALQDVPGQG